MRSEANACRAKKKGQQNYHYYYRSVRQRKNEFQVKKVRLPFAGVRVLDKRGVVVVVKSFVETTAKQHAMRLN